MSKFSKKAYESVASTISGIPLGDSMRDEWISMWSDMFKADNPRFNPRLFAEACKWSTTKNSEQKGTQ